MDLRHAAMGWSNGPIGGGNGRILALPSPYLLMLGSEHWHYDEAVRAGKRVLFRGMARQGFRPAELGWDVRRYVDEITRDAVRVSEPITDFVGWNELNLQDERGDMRPDFGDLTHLYSILGSFMLGVVAELRRRPVIKGARIHFGAWAPKDEMDYIDLWRLAAEACDVMNAHAYGHATGIVAHLNKYRAAFPGKPLELTEYHADGGPVEMDREALALFANEAAIHPDFKAYYFLYRWFDPPVHQTELADAIAVEGNDERRALFLDPPVVTRVPEPEEPPVPDFPLPAWTPAYEHIRDGALDVADEFGIPRRRMLGLCLAESGFRLQSFDRWHRWTSEAMGYIANRDRAGLVDILARCALVLNGQGTDDISFGPCHQTWRWSDEYDGRRYDLDAILTFRKRYIEDHGHALRAAAGKITAPGDDLDVLCRYNKPNVLPAHNQNRPNYERSLVEADRILAELSSEPPSPEPEDPTMYTVGPGIAAKMQEAGDEPATHEMAVQHDGQTMYAHAYGRSGAHYVYLPETNENHRFQPD